MANFDNLKTKKDRTAMIREKLGSNASWAVRGLVRIFENQTTDEQQAEVTAVHNGIGFTGADAEFLSSLAKQVLKGRTLSEKQMVFLFKKMPKYASQLEGVSRRVEK